MIGDPAGKPGPAPGRPWRKPLRLAPDHVSLYILENVEGLPFEKVLAGHPVDEDAVADIYKLLPGRARGGRPAAVRDLQFRPARQGMPAQPEILALRAFFGPGPVGLLSPRRQAMVQQAGPRRRGRRRSGGAVPALRGDGRARRRRPRPKKPWSSACGLSKESTSRPSGAHFGVGPRRRSSPRNWPSSNGEGWLLRGGLDRPHPPEPLPRLEPRFCASSFRKPAGQPPVEAVPLIACSRREPSVRQGASPRERWPVRPSDASKAVADPVKAEGVQRYFKDTVKAYGIAAPAVEETRGGPLQFHQGDLGLSRRRRPLRHPVPRALELEAKSIGALVLGPLQEGISLLRFCRP